MCIGTQRLAGVKPIVKPVASASTKAATKSQSPTPAADLSESLKGRIEPVRASMAYRAGLLMVAIAMLVLPVLYLSLVGLVCYAIYWHVVNDTGVLTIGSVRGGLVAYVGPIFVGCILLAFMIKPLLVRKQDDSVPLTLRQVDEPALFEFVYRLCRVLGAPAPGLINVDVAVNASASFRGGLRGLLRRDLVLTIGLPLAGCFDARQFAGVLAHELGRQSGCDERRCPPRRRERREHLSRARRDSHREGHADRDGTAGAGPLARKAAGTD